MSTERDRIIHNARLIRVQVRGKPKSERQRIYAAIALGTIGIVLMALMDGTSKVGDRDGL